jgi:hypothetical protein
VAARTAANRASVLHNNFANVPHHDVFELIKLKDPKTKTKDPKTKTEDPTRIQKLISSPILGEGDELLGVARVSRKGVTPVGSGPRFYGRRR